MPVIDSTTQNLKRYSEKMVKDVEKLIQNAINRVEVRATRDAPKFVTISSEFRDGGLTGEVGVMGTDDPLPAYFEFGTGLSAKKILAPYPQWIRDIAWKFKRPTDGRLKGTPYLYPNFLVEERRFLDDFKKLTNERFDDN